ncbi:MAG: hypothetical protein IIA59_08860 [Candidatus Marinimicrobia bacterium]|nr:hypothetical protein [Candidatus Neomarinimicrobiota bacterium]
MKYQDKSTIRKKVKIVQMDKHFLYLPVHYAKKCNFFDYIPREFEITEIITSDKRTDESAYAMLMDTTDRNSEIAFAVCDPTVILDMPPRDKNRSPAILAALITNAAFWAVNHKTHRIDNLKDLGKFDKIIAYPPGTTSYGIANRIYHDSRKKQPVDEFVEVVDSGRELLKLTDSEKSTVALSPNPLAIDALIGSSEEYEVDIALGNTPEYSNVLVTALLSRADIVREHPTLVEGLLKALQRSILLVQFRYPDVVQFTRDYFRYGERAEGALRMTSDDHVFPSNIEVSKAHWINAVRAALYAKKEPFGQAGSKRADEVFERTIEPYRHFAQAAVRDEILPRLAIMPKQARNRWELVKGYFLPLLWLTIGGIIVSWTHWSMIPVISLGMISASLLSEFAKLSKRPWHQSLHWFVWLLLIGGVIGWINFDWENSVVVPILIFLLLGDLYKMADLRRKRIRSGS